MKLILHKALLFIAVLMLLGNAAVDADETAAPANEAAPGVIAKVEKAIVHGVKVAAGGIEHGAKAAAHGIAHGAKATARGVKRGATAVGNAVHTVAEKLGGSPSPPASPDK